MHDPPHRSRGAGRPQSPNASFRPGSPRPGGASLPGCRRPRPRHHRRRPTLRIRSRPGRWSEPGTRLRRAWVRGSPPPSSSGARAGTASGTRRSAPGRDPRGTAGSAANSFARPGRPATATIKPASFRRAGTHRERSRMDIRAPRRIPRAGARGGFFTTGPASTIARARRLPDRACAGREYRAPRRRPGSTRARRTAAPRLGRRRCTNTDPGP